MDLYKLFLLTTLCVFSCFGREFLHYAGGCFRLVREPSRKFPVYLRSPFNDLLTRLDLHLKITVESEPNIRTLYESSDKIERVRPPCQDELFQIEMHRLPADNTDDRNLRLRISWPERPEEIDSAIALVPHNIDEIIPELYGLNGMFMMPVYFVKSKKEIVMTNRKARLPVAAVNKKTTRRAPLLIQYRLNIYHHELPATNILFYLTTTAILRNVYYLMIQTFRDTGLKLTIREREFISKITEKVVRRAKKSSTKAKIYVDADVKAVSFKWVGDDGNVANQIIYIKNGDDFELRADESTFHWNIFDIHSRELTSDVVRDCGEFCLYSVEALEKKCTWPQNEITVTTFGKLGHVLYERSKVVSTVENPWTVRVIRRAHEEEIQECKEMN